jgi:hypothetical protein
MKTKKESEFANFDAAMRKIIKVSHNELKAAMDAEKAAKKRKPKRTSASDRASSGKG